MNFNRKQNRKKIMICRNCGKLNHHIKDCYEPKTSFGIVLYKFINRKLHFLLIKRRNTLGFVQFVRGQYSISNPEYIQKLFNVMTEEEIQLIKTNDFTYLWRYLWKISEKDNTFSYDYKISLSKYNEIWNSKSNINIDYFISKRSTNYVDQEWGFPKGRKNSSETNVDTAVREFYEETGIDTKHIKVLNKKLIERYISYDDIEYKNIYYLAKYLGDQKTFSVSNKKEQFIEVSDIRFFTSQGAIDAIRDYSLKKKAIINLAEKYINKYL